jgi:dihydrofolate reductase
MPIKASAFIATSLDGFIARKDGNLDWLPGATASTEDYGYAEYMATVDVLVLGKHTFEKVLTFGEWPYSKMRVVVLSTSLTKKQIPEALIAEVELHPGPVNKLMNYLESSGASSVYVDGGKVIQNFLKENLLSQIIITTIPVLIGSGIPLFGDSGQDIKLKHIKTKAFKESGIVQNIYRVNT